MPDLIDKTALRQALVGGGVAAAVMGGGALIVGLSEVASSPRALLEAALPVAETLFSTGMIASSTMLALMLTMLGMTAEEHIKSGFYARIRQAATLATYTFCTATVVTLCLVIPFDEGGASETFYTVFYYAVTGIGALVGGALVAVVLTLHGAIVALVDFADDDRDAAIAEAEDA